MKCTIHGARDRSLISVLRWPWMTCWRSSVCAESSGAVLMVPSKVQVQFRSRSRGASVLDVCDQLNDVHVLDVTLASCLLQLSFASSS